MYGYDPEEGTLINPSLQPVLEQGPILQALEEGMGPMPEAGVRSGSESEVATRGESEVATRGESEVATRGGSDCTTECDSEGITESASETESVSEDVLGGDSDSEPEPFHLDDDAVPDNIKELAGFIIDKVNEALGALKQNQFVDFNNELVTLFDKTVDDAPNEIEGAGIFIEAANVAYDRLLKGEIYHEMVEFKGLSQTVADYVGKACVVLAESVLNPSL